MNKLLERALKLEENGYWQESVEVYKELLQEYPANPTALFFYGACLFNHEIYDEALDQFARSYNNSTNTEEKQRVLEHILTAYYTPNANEFKLNYQQNVTCLQGYEHNYIHDFPDYNDQPYLCIPRKDGEYYVLFKQTGQISENYLILGEGEGKQQYSIGEILITDIFDAQVLQTIETQTVNPSWLNNYKDPFYLLWEDPTYLIYLQLQDFSPLVSSNRLIFFPGYGEEFELFFKDPQTVLPNNWLGSVNCLDLFKDRLAEIEKQRKAELDAKLSFIQQMAEKYDHPYYRELFTGDVSNIRILFYTTRFSRVVQHSTRDFMKACQEHGMTCDILIEKSDIHRSEAPALVDKIAQFQPNVIFRINYYKADWTVIPKNILFLTWMQDPMRQIYSTDSARDFSPPDLAMALPGWLKIMIATGFDSSRLAPQVLPFNGTGFYPRKMSAEELEFYKSDIALPSNYSMPADSVADFVLSFYEKLPAAEPRDIKMLATRLMIQAYDIFRSQIEDGVLISNNEQCAKVIRQVCAAIGLAMKEEVVYQVAERFYLRICYGLHRRTTLKWVIDGGFQLKLWGRDWEKDDALKNFAHGILPYGEELAKMYSATKIVLATFSHYTSHFRVYEAMACGALPMLRYVPDEDDLTNLRDKFKENEHFVFYYGKQDLNDKLDYYLTHEAERQRIVANGRQCALNNMTYATVVDNFLKLAKSQY